ncbi:hypothetical protein JN01_0478 [Entomoplasma freundtii]|uniref:Uncharacterized protein n=1 Tax=Entomoplasma freundtii TaxID=74700 RepID=A0A2K8NQK8_9MOLU|nr:hypothetical protein [Entomoplasma freundtii]ATZ16122.1 hypothetical protein EFREU_v1c00950 [Entomoplasma freundtii]TDY56977.1 hypothetical protein JN01_0478 [Entomoplasma freundtii]
MTKEFKRSGHRLKNQKRIYRNFLLHNDLKTKEFVKNPASDQKNIIIKNLDFLLRLAKLKEVHFVNQMNIIRLLTSELYQLATKTGLKEDMKVLNKKIEANLDEYHLILIPDNLEKNLAREFHFTPEEITRYFSFHHIYSMLASTFASPFIDDDNYYQYYEYGYYLAMYLNLGYYSNKTTINPNYLVFCAKLKAQEKMIEAIQKITPEFFNLFVIKTNKWLSQVNYHKLEVEQRT